MYKNFGKKRNEKILAEKSNVKTLRTKKIYLYLVSSLWLSLFLRFSFPLKILTLLFHILQIKNIDEKKREMIKLWLQKGNLNLMISFLFYVKNFAINQSFFKREFLYSIVKYDIIPLRKKITCRFDWNRTSDLSIGAQDDLSLS